MLRVKYLSKNSNFKFIRLFSSAVQQEVSQNEVKYPPIIDTSSEQRRTRSKLEWHDKIKRCPTIEEKIIELNIPRYYGYKCLMLDGTRYPYNIKPFAQYITKTDFQELLPNTFADENQSKKIDGFLGLIKSDIQDALEFEIDAYKNSFEINENTLSKAEIERSKTSRLVKQLNRVLTNALGADNRHLFEADTDIDPRVEAFWFVGKFTPPLLVQRLRKRHPNFDKFEKEPVDRPFQFIGKPLLTLRHQNPLEPFQNLDFDSINVPNENIPSENVASVDPLSLGWSTQHRHGVCVPGFWPGNVREYGLLSYHDRSFLNQRPYGDNDETVISHGILSSYAWTYAQACYQGFSTYNDITYPLATQSIVTDGQTWSFFKYQLNTTIMHTHLQSPNHKFNQCWGTKEMKLFEHVDENGRIHGLNDDVLKTLIQFYINEPKVRSYEMKPYLDPKEKKIADIENVDRRQWLETIYKYLVSNRPRQNITPEIYSWEYIYKILYKTRPLDSKHRFFELGINPFQRRLSEHIPEYIPREFRPNGIHDKKKRKATFYPLDHCTNDPRIKSHSLYGAAKEGVRRKYDRYRRSFM